MQVHLICILPLLEQLFPARATALLRHAQDSPLEIGEPLSLAGSANFVPPAEIRSNGLSSAIQWRRGRARKGPPHSCPPVKQFNVSQCFGASERLLLVSWRSSVYP